MSLIYFLCGAMFVLFCHPVIEAFTELILTWLEVKKYQHSLKIAQYTKAMQDIQQECVPINTHTIGFAIEDEGVEYDDED